MQQLTGLDAAFLTLETANATGHVGGVCVLDPGDAPRPLTLARLTEVLAERLPLVPVLCRAAGCWMSRWAWTSRTGLTTRTSTSSITSGRSRCRAPARTRS